MILVAPKAAQGTATKMSVPSAPTQRVCSFVSTPCDGLSSAGRVGGWLASPGSKSGVVLWRPPSFITVLSRQRPSRTISSIHSLVDLFDDSMVHVDVG